MKNKNQGFSIPVLLVIIALVLIAGGAYLYQNKKVEAPVVESTLIEADESAPKVAPVAVPAKKAAVDPIKPVITSLTPSSVNLLSGFSIKGSNLDSISDVGMGWGMGWLTHSHVFVKIKNSAGQTGILWEGGSQGGNTSTANLITVTSISTSVCTVSEVGAGGCPTSSKMMVTPGQYILTVEADGRGVSDTVPLTVK